ncbi:hypothetical protein POM88_040806 [Heracleum sosnowskyi]|uniref:Uncharacterized protein n=1 Tax=Heracleum sosnowskyi TaxID=360622 RepID=A0AAD8HFI6_9APIA|nr:hypothetical protein POM88_040806 [Heracleum sosnowskyi]
MAAIDYSSKHLGPVFGNSREQGPVASVSSLACLHIWENVVSGGVSLDHGPLAKDDISLDTVVATKRKRGRPRKSGSAVTRDKPQYASTSVLKMNHECYKDEQLLQSRNKRKRLNQSTGNLGLQKIHQRDMRRNVGCNGSGGHSSLPRLKTPSACDGSDAVEGATDRSGEARSLKTMGRAQGRR